MAEKESPAAPEITEQQDKIVTKLGRTVVTFTKDGLTIQVEPESHPFPDAKDGSSG